MSLLRKGGGISKLSELEIDTNKTWRKLSSHSPSWHLTDFLYRKPKAFSAEFISII